MASTSPHPSGPSATTFSRLPLLEFPAWWATGPSHGAMEGRPPADLQGRIEDLNCMISKRIHRNKPTLPRNTLPFWRKWKNSWQRHEVLPQPLYPFKHLNTMKPTHPFISAHHACMASARASFHGISLSLATPFMALSQDKPQTKICTEPVPNAMARNCKEGLLKTSLTLFGNLAQPQCDFSKHQIRHLGFFDARFRTGTLRCSNQSSH